VLPASLRKAIGPLRPRNVADPGAAPSPQIAQANRPATAKRVMTDRRAIRPT